MFTLHFVSWAFLALCFSFAWGDNRRVNVISAQNYTQLSSKFYMPTIEPVTHEPDILGTIRPHFNSLIYKVKFFNYYLFTQLFDDRAAAADMTFGLRLTTLTRNSLLKWAPL